MTIHKRLVALARDPEIPRWCKIVVIGGLAIPGPVDELVIYPAVVGFVWLRHRHILTRHGFNGIHALAGLATMVLFGGLVGVSTHLIMRMVNG